MENIGTNQIH
uniref:Uncharacterized protein n=1 Tax=Arundo donax TaxID=35708 RepID=A0A0A9B391_ARUDO